MEFLAAISVKCFVASYLVAFVIELTRPFIRLPARMVLLVGFTVAGLFAHIAYLAMSAREQMGGREIGLLASWYDWALMLALAVALLYGVLLLVRPKSTFGYFLLPVVLGLITLAWFLQGTMPFSRVEAISVWRAIHGMTMLLVSISVLFGFIAGILFLLQSYRLKHKKLASEGMRLPSLEWSQSMNRICLTTSTVLMSLGLLSGIALQLNDLGSFSLTQGGILLSFVLFVWLVVATAFELFNKAVGPNRKIIFLTFASFGFLVLAVIGVLSGGHGAQSDDDRLSTSQIVVRDAT